MDKNIELEGELDMLSYRRHSLLEDADSIQNEDTVPLVVPTTVRTKPKGLFGFISSIFSQSEQYVDTSKCSICNSSKYCVIEGVPYCKVYADILIGRKDKSIPVTCSYNGLCTYPDCRNTGKRFLYDSNYVTEGYYCPKHVRHIDMMIMQETTVQYILKRSERITKYSDIQSMEKY